MAVSKRVEELLQICNHYRSFTSATMAAKTVGSSIPEVIYLMSE